MANKPSALRRNAVKTKAVKPARRRRKESRPDEIVQAAIEVFSRQGFGAAKLEEVARRAGVSKGTLFVYFPSKEALFRAVARSIFSAHMAQLATLAANGDQPIAKWVPPLLARFATVGSSGLPAFARLLIAESRTFPDLARVWHDEVASKVFFFLTAAIERAQERGEVRPGDPRLYAFSIVGPMLAATLFREIFKEASGALPDLHKLSLQHSQALLRGVLSPVDERVLRPGRGR